MKFEVISGSGSGVTGEHETSDPERHFLSETSEWYSTKDTIIDIEATQSAAQANPKTLLNTHCHCHCLQQYSHSRGRTVKFWPGSRFACNPFNADSCMKFE